MLGGRLVNMVEENLAPITAGLVNKMIFHPTGFGRYVLGSPEARAIGAGS